MKTQETLTETLATKHTPGPWRIGDGGYAVFGPKTEHPAPVTICELPTSSPRVTRDERRANARLIAASPDTLSMLVRLTEKVERANAIQHSGGSIEPEDWSELYQLTNEARAAIAKATQTL